jgi:hypothetical protein
MSPENKNGQNIIQLSDYIDTRLEDLRQLVLTNAETNRFGMQQLEKSVDARFHAVDAREQLARETNTAKLESMNEFRGQVKDQQSTFMPKAEALGKFSALDAELSVRSERFAKIESNIAKMEGRLIAGGTGVALFSIAISLILHFAGK